MIVEADSLSREEELDKLKDKYQKITSVLSAHQIALWEYDIATGQCSFTDDYFRILGLKEAGIVFKDIDDFYQYAYPEDILPYRNAFSRMLESETKSSQIQVRCIGCHGEVIWLEDHFLSYQKNKAGHPEKIIAYTINVTSQCEKEAHIRRLEDRNRKIIEALPEFVFIFDDNFFITDVLMAPDTVLLHPVELLKGADGRSIYNQEVSDLFIRNIGECLKDGQMKEIEYPLDVESVRYYFQARIAPFEDNKVLALIHDIGDRVRHAKELIEAKRKAEEADRMKSVFLANMSHEIRTPLNAIVGFSEIVAFTDDPEEKEEYVNIIRKNSNLLLQLINDILDLSRIESGKSEMHLQSVEMSALIDEVEKVHRLKMNDGVEFKVVRPQEEIFTMTDRNRVTQVLFNFLSNAIKNTKHGSITLGMCKEGDWLKLYVRDTGCGISKEKLPLIFTRFEKLNDFVQGTGLGLPICQSIVERLGGRIDVESEVGVGSTFALYLPCQQIKSSVTDTEYRAGQKRILVAEDVEVNYMQINAFLKREYSISWVINGEEAVRSFLRDRPDLILMDIRMPVMNGIEATEKIRAMSADIPIIAVTANAFYTEQKQALAAGCNDVVSKPYSMEQLKAVIEKYI
ncbi:ATP-binding protein [Bacteroides sp.]